MTTLLVFLIRPGQSIETLAHIPSAIPENSFLWLSYTRPHFEQNIGALQVCLEELTGARLLDLHVSDLINAQLPSHFDYTSVYDLLIFRQLKNAAESQAQAPSSTTPWKLRTEAAGFVVFDQVLVSVHSEGCGVRDAYIERLKRLSMTPVIAGRAPAIGASPGASRLPDSPAELMLRLVSLMVDGFLDLRKRLTRELDVWQQRLLRPAVRFDDWGGLLEARQALHRLSAICEDQHNALDNWLEVLEDMPLPGTQAAQREHDQLTVRSRDVIEHIERVSHHVSSLEHSAETAVQIHFNIQSNRANDVMRTLTAITAVFLPLNLIAGIFGMNFEFIPWLHTAAGFWVTLFIMSLIGGGLLVYFVRKRYLSSSEL